MILSFLESTGAIVATAIVTLAGAKSRLGATVSKKYSAQFAAQVSWQRVDASGAAIDDEDITDNGSGDDNSGGTNSGGGSGGGTGSITPSGGGGDDPDPEGDEH